MAKVQKYVDKGFISAIESTIANTNTEQNRSSFSSVSEQLDYLHHLFVTAGYKDDKASKHAKSVMNFQKDMHLSLRHCATKSVQTMAHMQELIMWMLKFETSTEKARAFCDIAKELVGVEFTPDEIQSYFYKNMDPMIIETLFYPLQYSVENSDSQAVEAALKLLYYITDTYFSAINDKKAIKAYKSFIDMNLKYLKDEKKLAFIPSFLLDNLKKAMK